MWKGLDGTNKKFVSTVSIAVTTKLRRSCTPHTQATGASDVIGEPSHALWLALLTFDGKG